MCRTCEYEAVSSSVSCESAFLASQSTLVSTVIKKKEMKHMALWSIAVESRTLACFLTLKIKLDIWDVGVAIPVDEDIKL
jgi:hypothetical protein